MKKILIFICVIYIFVSKVIAFSDSNDFYWAKDSIDKWSQKGFISGYPDGSFRGNSFITRAEVISVINKINNSKENIDKRVAKDVETDNWFFYEIGKGVKTGIISIDEDGKFRPNDFATREEVMVILSKLFNINYSGKVENSKISSFSDYTKVNSKDFYRVAGIVEDGVIAGYPDNTLRPDGNITRAEFITILSNLIKEVFSRGDYNNKVFKGNIVINDENVKITNSEIYGKVFVLDGAKNDIPELINTKVSKGVNSRVGEILIKNTDKYETVTEHNIEQSEERRNPIFAKVTYSETGWTNKDVIAKIKIDNKDYKVIKGDNRIVFDRNGEEIVEYEYEGDIVKVKVKVENIDKISPKVTPNLTYTTISTEHGTKRVAMVTLDIIDDNASLIERIKCSNGVINEIDKDTKEIDKTIMISDNGKYTIWVLDEAGNESSVKVEVDMNEDTLSAEQE